MQYRYDTLQVFGTRGTSNGTGLACPLKKQRSQAKIPRMFISEDIYTLPLDKPYSATLGFKATTIPALFLERCARTPANVAFKYKDRGLYKEVLWFEYLQHVENFCLGLSELGLRKGDTVAIIGDSCPEWLYSDIAIQSAGATSYGIYATSSIPETKWMLENGGAKFVIAEDQEFVDKILPVANELPQLRKIIVIDNRAMFMYDDDMILGFKKVEEIGAERKAKEPGVYAQLVSDVKPEDPATIVYTSGTTGMPRGVVITHYNLLWARLELVFLRPEFLDPKATSVAYLPLAHVLGRFQDAYFPMIGNHITHFGEDPALLAETLYEVSPTIFMGIPRAMEKFAAQILVGIETSSWIKKRLYEGAMKIGRRYIEKKWEHQVPLLLLLLYQLSRLIVFKPLLEKVGFGRVRVCGVGGAPVPPEVLALWQIWGVPAGEIYGQTEAGNISAQIVPFAKPGTAGRIFPRTEWIVDSSGELLVKGPGVFLGYFGDEESTRRVKDGDGYIHTGDIAVIDEKTQEIRIIDRLKDIQITSGGKNIAPSGIEKAIKASPYISEAVLFADGHKFPAALIEIDYDTVSEFARENSILYTSFESLVTHPKVIELIDKEIKKANEKLARVEQVKKFRIIPKELDPEDEKDPITSTRKVRRKSFYESYHDLVDSMFEEEADEKESIVRELGEVKERITANKKRGRK
jgi:long-chain acyl-CoA synthetase